MMSSKTGIQELIEWLKDHEDNIDPILYSVFSRKFYSLIETEKDQIRKAFNRGNSLASEITSEEYYKQEYEQ